MRNITLALFFFLVSCSGNQNAGLNPGLIDLESKVGDFNSFRLSELGAEINYIILENGDKSLRGIYEADFRYGKIVVSDRSICLLYDAEGELISEIGTQGRGPEEFNLISALALGKESVYIQDGMVFKEYDFNGKFISKIFAIEKEEILFGGSWFNINDSLFLFKVPNRTGQCEICAVLFNKTGSIIKRYPNYARGGDNPYRPTLQNIADIYLYNDTVHFRDWMNDTLFVLTENLELIPKYVLYLGKYRQPECEILSKEGPENQFDFISIGWVFETSRHLFLNCLFNDYSPARREKPIEYRPGVLTWFYAANVVGVYDKKSNDLRFSKPLKTENKLVVTGITNDIDGGPSFEPAKTVNDSTLVMWFTPFDLKKHVESDEFVRSKPLYPEKKSELKMLADSLDENDNPILMFVTFKE